LEVVDGIEPGLKAASPQVKGKVRAIEL